MSQPNINTNQLGPQTVNKLGKQMCFEGLRIVSQIYLTDIFFIYFWNINIQKYLKIGKVKNIGLQSGLG